MMKILTVDDDPVFQDILTEMLRMIGQHNITKAPSAAAALATMQSQDAAFDCILLDIQMPGMNGVSFCKVVRDLPAYRRVPIVMVTSESAKQYIDGAFAAGATDYVAKPLNRLDLMARIGMVAKLIEERRMVAEMTLQANQRQDVVEMQMDFETAILIPGFDRSIEYLALENYLLTLGKKGMLASAAFAIRIDNAGLIFRRTARANFVDMLRDIGTVISDIIKTDDMLIAYAGNGNFVCVTRNALTFSSEDMTGMMDAGLADFENFYELEGFPMPRLRVGPLVKSSFLSLGSPTRILDRAIQSMQQGRDKKSGHWQSAA